MSSDSGEEYQNAVKEKIGSFHEALSKVDDSFQVHILISKSLLPIFSITFAYASTCQLTRSNWSENIYWSHNIGSKNLHCKAGQGVQIFVLFLF